VAQVVRTAQERQFHAGKVDDLHAVASAPGAFDVMLCERVAVMTVSIGMPLNHDNAARCDSHTIPVSTVRAMGRQADCTRVGWRPNGAGIVTVADLLEQLARKPEHQSNREKRRAAAVMDETWDE